MSAGRSGGRLRARRRRPGGDLHGAAATGNGGPGAARRRTAQPARGPRDERRLSGYSRSELGFLKHSAWRRSAIVSDAAWVKKAFRTFAWMTPGEVKVYDLGEEAEARAWVAG
ncbi:MAG: STAS/SEC14 domain-containing protein [Thermoleophilia bacterium]|nr:STAS/SEC14 domain-containing protein [Thermoleophilia bacterium]